MAASEASRTTAPDAGTGADSEERRTDYTAVAAGAAAGAGVGAGPHAHSSSLSPALASPSLQLQPGAVPFQTGTTSTPTRAGEGAGAGDGADNSGGRSETSPEGARGHQPTDAQMRAQARAQPDEDGHHSDQGADDSVARMIRQAIEMTPAAAAPPPEGWLAIEGQHRGGAGGEGGEGVVEGRSGGLERQTGAESAQAAGGQAIGRQGPSLDEVTQSSLPERAEDQPPRGSADDGASTAKTWSDVETASAAPRAVQAAGAEQRQPGTSAQVSSAVQQTRSAEGPSLVQVSAAAGVGSMQATLSSGGAAAGTAPPPPAGSEPLTVATAPVSEGTGATPAPSAATPTAADSSTTSPASAPGTAAPSAYPKGRGPGSRQRWTPTEDQRLIEYVQAEPPLTWEEIGTRMGRRATGCSMRWYKYLREKFDGESPVFAL